MHFFSRRPTQPVSTKTKPAPLIYGDNRALLEGKREKLAYSEEALDNLAASTGVIRPEGCGCAGCMGCASVYVMGLAIVFIALGVLLMIVGIGWLLHSPHLAPNTTIPALLLVVGVILLSPGGGPQHILRSHAAEQHRIYIRGLYDRLIARGQIVEGTITSVEPVVVEGVATPQVILHYRFALPGQYGDYEGQYKTWSKKGFTSEQKVTVLCLGRFVQVLL